MSIKMIDFKKTDIPAFGLLAIGGAFILDHFCNGGRALDFFVKKFTGFRKWVTGNHRNPNDAGIQANQNDAVVQAYSNDAGNQANPNDAGTQANPNDAGTQANPNDAGIQANPNGASI